MSACEKCWADARQRASSSGRSHADAYYALLVERSGGQACTPEEQAGPDARECAMCSRRTVHKYAGECMACGHLEYAARLPGHAPEP